MSWKSRQNVVQTIRASTKASLRILNNNNHNTKTIKFGSYQHHQREQRSVISGLTISQNTTTTNSKAISRIYNDPLLRPALPTSPFSMRGVASLGKTQGNLVILGFKLFKDLSTDNYSLIVVSPRNYFVFTPLLASTSVGTLEFRCITEPVRKFVPKVDFYQAYADTIDFEKQIVHCTSNLEKKRDKFSLSYDTLVIAVGANSNTFGIPGVGEYALFLKDVSDARKIRQRVIECFEHASQPGVTEETKLGLLHFVVVGGGPTVRLSIYDIAPQILGSFDIGLRDYATKKFTRKGIQIRTNKRVMEIKANHLIIREEGEVPYGMIVWATGLTDNPLTRNIGDRIMKDDTAKRLLTDDKLRIIEKNSGKPITNVYAIGDCATIKDNDLPPTAQVANQKARYLRRVLQGLAIDPQYVVNPFKFHNFGVMAYIGKKEALVDMTKAVSPQAKESGMLAWLLWRSVYLSYTVSIRNRLLIPMYWFLTLLFGRDISRF
ncbi:4448_t:CDS:10 [Ambispora gerdemannii]|uniref:NADH:ubiquinone reductase (non-electrogenic) n=1 Tax=Ambispora gerdemannii TaxID=144530 RepID=A0A9N8VNI4_9GLOM|nr:4448_t:CDS:10 [Ambispora gerdemannii]